MSFVVHPNIAPDKVEERSYQTSMVNGCLRSNTLLILPTGLGKTIVALRVAADFVDRGKVIILAPTKPLLDQHYDTFSSLMVGHSVCILSGNVSPQKRVDMFD
jgi:Fanconi anemia group M protein